MSGSVAHSSRESTLLDAVDNGAWGRHLAVFLAIPASVLVLAAAEWAFLPTQWLLAAPGRALGALVLAVDATVRVVWPAIAFQVAVGLLVALSRRRQAIGAVVRLALAASCVAIAIQAYRIVVRDDALSGRPVLIATFVGFALLLVGWTQLMATGSHAGPGLARRTWTRWGVLGVAAIGFLSAHVLNHAVLPETYPSVHASGLLIAYLLAHAAISEWMVLGARSRHGRAVMKGASVTLPLVALCAVGAGWAPIRRLEPILIRHT